MRSTIKFLKKNWFFIALLIVAFIFLRKWGTGYYEQKREIRDLSYSIHVKDIEYRQRGDSLLEVTESAQKALNEREIYKDSVQILKTRIRNLTYRHEIEMDNLNRIPTDSLYLELTRWLESLSFE